MSEPEKANIGESSPWVGSKALMQRLSISRSTVGRMVQRGCPHIYVGSQRRFNLNQVIQWLKEQG